MHLNINDTAPSFEAKDQHGNTITLQMFKGRKVILYFYPKDDTPGCTAEACDLRDNYQILLDKGFVVIGVSADNEKSHQKFSQKYNLPFPLLIDSEKNICTNYGIWGPKKFMGREFEGINRTTFIISEEGLIEHVFAKVDTQNHTTQILNYFSTL